MDHSFRLFDSRGDLETQFPFDGTIPIGYSIGLPYGVVH